MKQIGYQTVSIGLYVFYRLRVYFCRHAKVSNYSQFMQSTRECPL